MAGPVRQSINLVLLERYIDSHVPELQGPLKLKQVRRQQCRSRHTEQALLTDSSPPSLALVSPIPLTSSPMQREGNLSFGRNHRARFYHQWHIR